MKMWVHSRWITFLGIGYICRKELFFKFVYYYYFQCSYVHLVFHSIVFSYVSTNLHVSGITVPSVCTFSRICVTLKCCREEWVAAIKMVSENLTETCQDIDMGTGNQEEYTTKDLSEKFSLQGTSISKSTGKTKVTLESFEFHKVLGKGTFGKVILCREKATGRLFAIKILKKEVIIQKDEVQHTQTESRVLRSTNHPFLTVSFSCRKYYLNLYLLI